MNHFKTNAGLSQQEKVELTTSPTDRKQIMESNKQVRTQMIDLKNITFNTPWYMAFLSSFKQSVNDWVVKRNQARLRKIMQEEI